MVNRATLRGIQGILERTRAQAAQHLNMSRLATLPFRLTGADKQTALTLAQLASRGIAEGELDPIIIAHQALIELEAAATSIKTLEQQFESVQQQLASAQESLGQRPTQEALTRVEQQAESLRNQLEGKAIEFAALNNSLEQLRLEFKQVQERAQALEQEKEQLKTTNAQLVQTNEELQTSLAQAPSLERVQQLEQTIARNNATIQHQSERLVALEAEKQSLTEKAATAAGLQMELTRVSGELGQARSALVNANQDLARETQARAAAEQLAAQAQRAAVAPEPVGEIIELAGVNDRTYANGAFALMTNVGRIRSDNQDSGAYAELPDGRKVYIVADGMGGHGGGEIASRLVIHEFIEALRNGQSPLEALNTANRRVIELGLEEARPILLQRVHQAAAGRLFSDILDLADQQGWSLLYILENFDTIARDHGIELARLTDFVELFISAAKHKKHIKGPGFIGINSFGTTIVAAILDETNQVLQLVHVGDSRIKMVTPSEALILTADHSLKLDFFRQTERAIEFPASDAVIDHFDAWYFQHNNVITSAIGGLNLKTEDLGGDKLDRPELRAPDSVNVMEIPIRPASEPTNILLYSDGTIDGLAESALTQEARSADRPTGIVDAIMGKALEVSKDNITIAAVSLPFALDLANRREVRSLKGSANMWERVVNGQAVEELSLRPDGRIEVRPVEDNSIDVDMGPVTHREIPLTFDAVAKLPLRNQLRQLGNSSISREIRGRLLTEVLIPAADSRYQQVFEHLTDQDPAVREAAQEVMLGWVMEKLRRLTTIDDANYAQQMSKFLLDNHASELKRIISESLGDAQVMDMARTIWQTHQSEPAQAETTQPSARAAETQPMAQAEPKPQGPTLRQVLANPLDVQIRMLRREQMGPEVREQLFITLSEQATVAKINKLRKKSRDQDLRTDAENFMTTWLTRLMTHAQQDKETAKSLVIAVKELGIQDLVKQLALDPKTTPGLRQEAVNLFNQTKGLLQRGLPH